MFDLVITDILMPEKEGLETIREMRQKHPTVKIVAMSGAPASWRVLELAQKFGAMKTVAKPFKKFDLIAAVDEVLKSAKE